MAAVATAFDPLGNSTDSVTCPCKPSTVAPTTLKILALVDPGIRAMVEWNADDYYAHTNGAVKIDITTASSMATLYEEIEMDARNGGGLFDAYYTNPQIMGTAAALNGFHDLTPYIKISPSVDWTDVLPALRQYYTSFEDKTYLIPFDGDTINLFYRKDIFKAFDLQAPRTWSEYNQVARTIHGKIFNGTTLTGNCMQRGNHAQYWYHMVLATITQTHGTSEGSLFDTKDMSPLLGEAAVEMLRIHEEQAKYGAPDEFTAQYVNDVHVDHMHGGTCAMTIMWGGLFKTSMASGSSLYQNLGIAPTPGSEVVLNRKTGKLQKCTLNSCPHAKYYDDIGFVNSAPYAANGLWGVAVSANTSPSKQKLLADFLLWSTSGQQGLKYTVPNATLPRALMNGQDQFRKSQLDVELWVRRGYDRDLANDYVHSVNNVLISQNVVVDARFPMGGAIMSVLADKVTDHLHSTLSHPTDEMDMFAHVQRMDVADHIASKWAQIIQKFDARGDTLVPILESYQRLRGVWVPNEKKHHLTGVRPVGLAMMALIFLFSLTAATWVYSKRNLQVIRASQPPFLWLICGGTAIMGSSIWTMGIDDSIASQEGCNVACMLTPWLVCVGFSITFSALVSKIMRLQILMKNAARFKRIQVKVKDVLLPFATILVFNCTFLLAWTLADPLYWERVDSGRTENGEIESYGRCVSSGKVSTAMISMLVGINLLALLTANILAYQTRNLDVSFSEGQYVNMAVFSILEALLFGVPIVVIVYSNPVASYVVRTLFVFVVCMVVLGFIFIPKYWMSNLRISSRMSGGGAPSGLDTIPPDTMPDEGDGGGLDRSVCSLHSCFSAPPKSANLTSWMIATGQDETTVGSSFARPSHNCRRNKS